MIDARTLSKALVFVSPLVERRGIGAETSFVTHLPDGRVVGGTPRAFAMVEGLPAPPTAMIYRRPSVDVLAAFLARLGGEAKVEISERSYRFTCPSMGHDSVSRRIATHPRRGRRWMTKSTRKSTSKGLASRG